MSYLVRTSLLSIIIFIITSFIFMPSTHANVIVTTPLILDETSEREDLYSAIDLIKDRHGKYTIEDMFRAEVAEQFTNIDNVEQISGFFYQGNWMRFTIENDGKDTHWLLEFSFPLINELQLYTMDDGKITKLYDTGANYPFRQRPKKHRNFVLDLDIEQGETKTYYAYASGSGDLHPPIIVWSQDAFASNSQNEFLLLGIFYGISLVMIFYNLFLYFSLRMKSYLFYVLTITFTLLGKVSINGLGYQYLWPNFPYWNMISATICVSIASIFILIFTRYFLDVDKYIPTFKLYYYLFITLNIFVILSIAYSRYVALFLMILIGVSTFVFALTTAVICLIRGAREARFFVLGWVIFLTGVSITMLERAVVLPYSIVTEYAGQSALTIEVVLLSLALADKFNIIRQEKRIAERKAIENQELALQHLKQADELKNEFLAITSHELRTPLYGMIGIAESLRDGVAGPLQPKVLNQLSMIITSGKRLTGLVNDILDFSRLKYKSVNLNVKPIKINSILHIVLAILNPLLRDKSINIINKIDDALPSVMADENRSQQIFYNLLDNATKFTEKGTITIDATEENNYLHISITDTGSGIPKEQLETIFQPFQQGESSLSRKVGGIGIGLSVTKSLVELHEGKIDVTSAVGKGTTFTVSLPIADGTSKTKEKQVTDKHEVLKEESNILQFPQPLNKDNRKILVVDDEIVNVQVLMNQLTLQGYDIYTSLRGEDVFTLVEKNDIDLIILDIMMPGMSGYEVCQQLRKKHSLMELPILMLTAKNQLQDKTLAFEAGANDYLVKPCDKQELLSRVKTLVKMKSLNEEIVQMNIHLEDKVLERTNELKISNEKLKEVAASRRKLLANIAHELGTPVTIIYNFFQSLQQEIISIDDEHYRKLVTDKLNVLNRLIEDLYQLSILESENISFNLTVQPLQLCVRQIIENSKLTVLQSKRLFSTNPLPDSLEHYVCSVDNERIDQLFSNLISNAIKNTVESDGEISIDVNLGKNEVTIAIIDNGRGIAEKELQYVFERFYKQQSRSDEPTGTGLGLAIAKQIVDNHHGGITVESTIGIGTTFYVSLPVQHLSEVEQIDNQFTKIPSANS